MSDRDDDHKEDAGGTGDHHEDETSLWKAATHDVKPLAGRRYREGRVLKPKPPAAALDHAREQINPTGRYFDDSQEGAVYERHRRAGGDGGRHDTGRHSAGRHGTAGGDGIDRRTLQRLERGQMEIEARLDLHGLNQAQAREALLSFIAGNYGAGKRCILVITGKGRCRGQGGEWWSSAPGVLRRKAPEWIAEEPSIAKMVVRTALARPQHGGDGAFYIFLRRKRSGR